MEQHGTTTLELQLISAKGLKNETLFTKMDVYAVVSIDDGAHNVKQTATTTLVQKCGTKPTFNYTMRFTLDDSLLHNHLSSLKIQLVCTKRNYGNYLIAAFHVPSKELFDSANPKDMKFITSCQVWRVFSRKTKGELSFSYKFGDKLLEAPAKKVQPVKSYPVQASPPVQQQAEKKKSWMGLDRQDLIIIVIVAAVVAACL